LADGWRELARTERGTARLHLLVHSLTLYQKAVPQLTGAFKTQAEKHVAELERELPKDHPPAGPYARFRGRWVIKYTNKVVREYLIDDQGALRQAGEITAGGQFIKANRAGKLTNRGNDVVVDLGDGTLERLSLRKSDLYLDHYSPSGLYPGGRPSLTAIGLKKR
jgi:hypothetical protein